MRPSKEMFVQVEEDVLDLEIPLEKIAVELFLSDAGNKIVLINISYFNLWEFNYIC